MGWSCEVPSLATVWICERRCRHSGYLMTIQNCYYAYVMHSFRPQIVSKPGLFINKVENNNGVIGFIHSCLFIVIKTRSYRCMPYAPPLRCLARYLSCHHSHGQPIRTLIRDNDAVLLSWSNFCTFCAACQKSYCENTTQNFQILEKDLISIDINCN